MYDYDNLTLKWEPCIPFYFLEEVSSILGFQSADTHQLKGDQKAVLEPILEIDEWNEWGLNRRNQSSSWELISRSFYTFFPDPCH